MSGQQSICDPPNSKIQLVLGQDKSVFVPHSTKNTYWSFDGVTPCQTKTEDMGIMISTFASCEFGIGFGLQPGEPLSVYSAKDVNVTTKKPMLKTDPCYIEFLYGKN